MGPNFLGKQLSVISKIVSRQRQQPSIKKVTIAARAPANKAT
jgi:hypothetical protein